MIKDIVRLVMLIAGCKLAFVLSVKEAQILAAVSVNNGLVGST